MTFLDLDAEGDVIQYAIEPGIRECSVDGNIDAESREEYDDSESDFQSQNRKHDLCYPEGTTQAMIKVHQKKAAVVSQN